MSIIKTGSKVVDGVVIVSSLAVGISAAIATYQGIKSRKAKTIAIGTLTLLIASYALKQAVTKINA